jgi:hypothetical protein
MKLHQVEKLFVQMYEHMKDTGLTTPVYVSPEERNIGVGR